MSEMSAHQAAMGGIPHLNDAADLKGDNYGPVDSHEERREFEEDNVSPTADPRGGDADGENPRHGVTFQLGDATARPDGDPGPEVEYDGPNDVEADQADGEGAR